MLFKFLSSFILILIVSISQNQCVHVDYNRMISAIEGLVGYYSKIKQEIILDSTLSFHFTEGNAI